MTLPYDIVPTIALCVVAVFAINAAAIYSITKLLITGRTLVEKREQEPERESRLVHMPGGR